MLRKHTKPLATVCLLMIVLTFSCTQGQARPGSLTSGTSDEEVSYWLRRAEVAEHNGLNPQLELPEELIVDHVEAWKSAVREGPRQRRLDAASAIGRHPRPIELRDFWREQLQSDLQEVRFWAIIFLAEAHVPEDFVHVLALVRTDSANAHALASRLRDWKDPRAIPALASLLDHPERVVAENAATSLSQLPGVPQLPEEVIGKHVSVHLPNGAWTAPETSRVPPYRRWWENEGRAQFHKELEWWANQGRSPID